MAKRLIFSRVPQGRYNTCAVPAGLSVQADRSLWNKFHGYRCATRSGLKNTGFSNGSHGSHGLGILKDVG